MRKLTEHLTGVDKIDTVEINVLDNPGEGNACHDYEIVAGDVTNIIKFQNGPVKEAGINGISNEALLAVVIDRLKGFQKGPFSCKSNACALTHLEEAMMWLHSGALR